MIEVTVLRLTKVLRSIGIVERTDMVAMWPLTTLDVSGATEESRSEPSGGSSEPWSRGDDDANLNIAKIYLQGGRNLEKAIHYLKETVRSRATEGSREEAGHLLVLLRSRKTRPASRNE